MEEKYQDILEKIFDKELIKINIKYKTFGLYDVEIKTKINGVTKMVVLPFKYDAMFTLEANIEDLKNKIENSIVNLFKKGEIRNDKNNCKYK